MSEFSATLQAFLAGQAEFSAVDAALTRALAADPSAGPAMFAAIDQLYRGGRLPLQLYVMLKNKIAASHAAAGGVAARRGPSQSGPSVVPAQSGAPPHRSPAQGAGPVPPPSSPQPPVQPSPAAASPGAASPQAPGGAGGAAPQAEDDEDAGDRTILRAPAARPAGPQPAGPPAGSGFSGPGGAAERADVTGSTGPATGQHTGGPGFTGPSTGQFTGQHTGQHTGQFTGQHTGRTSGSTAGTDGSWSTNASGWTSPSQWGEQDAPKMEPGSVLKGRFVLETIVGRGGMGVVFRAKDLRKEEAQDRDPYVAIKILNDEFRRHPESLKALQRESRKAQNLAHPNIATVFDFDRDGATVYMQMEFLEGESLDRITKNKTFEGMPFDEAFPLIEGLGRALSYAHAKGIVHSDFKPGNCFLTKSGVIKVFDFGIARAAKVGGNLQGEVTRFDPGTLGALTPAYASCEMIEGQEPDPRDDIYALGCVAYELLTGRHPFNKRSATEARDGGLQPPAIRNLSRTRARALARSVAFRREDRSASVDDFLDDLRGQKIDIPLIGGIRGLAATIVVVVIVAAGAIMLPGYLEQRNINAIIAALSSLDENRVLPAIEDYRALDAGVQATVLPQVRDALLEFFATRIGSALDRTQGRYDYPTALAMLDQADTLITDSATLNDLRSQVETGLANLLQELDTRFNDNLQAQRILSDPDADDIPEVLTILEQADPGNALLSDPRLAFAYADAAESALAEERLLEARNYVSEGLARYASDGRLVDINDELTAALEAQADALRLDELRQQIGDVAALASLEDVRGIEAAVAEFDALLTTAGQTDPLLDTYRTRLNALLGAELGGLLEARDWAGAGRLIEEFAAGLSETDLRDSRARVDTARGGYESERDGLVASLNEAAGAGSLDQAIAQLEALTALGVDDATIQRGRGSIEQGYVRLARAARAGGDMAGATGIVTTGLAFAPDSGVLRQEQNAITQAQRLAEAADAEAAAQQFAAEIQGYRDGISTALAAASFGIDEATSVLADIDALAALDASDPLVASGRTDVAGRLAAAARALGADSRFEEALALVDNSINLISEADILRTTRGQLVQGQGEFEQARQQELVAEQRRALDDLLAAPTYDAAWENETRRLIGSLGRLLPQTDPTVGNASAQAGRLYLARATEMRGQERLSEAERLLTIAAGFAPGLESIALEQEALMEAQRRFAAENAADLQRAEIEGLQRSFMTAANANDIGQARSALATLRERLPAGDPFLTETAPQQLAAILLRLATSAYTESRFDQAERLAQQGLEEAPGTQALQDLMVDVRGARLESNVGALGARVTSGPYDDVDGSRRMLASIQADAGNDFENYRAELIAGVEQRIASAGANPGLAEWARAVFNREFTIAAPAPATAPATAPAAAPAAARAGGNGRACTPDLATFGQRAQGQCYDAFADDTQGPRLVVVPAGGAIAAPFAISRFEIAVANWNDYCRLSGACSGVAGENADPMTNVSIDDARAYAQWLTSTTGFQYRLPTQAEWLHTASAERGGSNDDNCVVAAAGRGGRTRQVNAGSANVWGVSNIFGNVQEWVTTAGGVEARGGNFQDALNDCSADRAVPHSGAPDAVTGFRLVRNLEGG